jgi:hypothetical protein
MSNVLTECGLKEVVPLEIKGDLGLPPRTIGIEIEMENAAHLYNPSAKAKKIWSAKEDHSLRDGGIEFVSRPLNPNGLEEALSTLKASLAAEIAFSPRTSVHVHVNVQDLDFDKLALLVRFYRLFEGAFFDFIGRKRARNTYCCPLFLTRLSSFLHPTRWPKYTALNLRPVTTQGTVEFRHMHGTLDTEKLIVWVAAIVNLVDFIHQQEIAKLKELLYKTTIHSVEELFINVTQSKLPFSSIPLEVLIAAKLELTQPTRVSSGSAYMKGLSKCAA